MLQPSFALLQSSSLWLKQLPGELKGQHLFLEPALFFSSLFFLYYPFGIKYLRTRTSTTTTYTEAFGKSSHKPRERCRLKKRSEKTLSLQLRLNFGRQTPYQGRDTELHIIRYQCPVFSKKSQSIQTEKYNRFLKINGNHL